MNIDTFLIIVALHWPSYLLALLLSILTLLPIMRKHTYGWLDPLCISLIFAMFANAVPIFFLFNSLISTENFIYFLLSEVLFWCGFLVFSRKHASFNSHFKIKFDRQLAFQLYLIFIVLYVSFTLLNYAIVGIPLFSDTSRLAVYSNSGGLGILSRFNGFFGIYTLAYSFYLLHYKQRRILAGSVIALSCIFLVLTASKSAFLNLAFAYWGFQVYYRRHIPRSRYIFGIFLLGGFAAVLIIFLRSLNEGGSWLTSIINIMVRLAGSGDVYMAAYPNNTYDVVHISNPSTSLFSGLLQPLRLIDTPPPSIGNQLAWHVFPSSEGKNVGPNARMPVLSFILMGWGGLILSVVAGFITSFLLFKLPQYLPKGIISTALMTYIYSNAILGITDFALGIGLWFDFAINIFILLALICLLSKQLTNSTHLSFSQR